MSSWLKFVPGCWLCCQCWGFHWSTKGSVLLCIIIIVKCPCSSCCCCCRDVVVVLPLSLLTLTTVTLPSIILTHWKGNQWCFWFSDSSLWWKWQTCSQVCSRRLLVCSGSNDDVFVVMIPYCHSLFFLFSVVLWVYLNFPLAVRIFHTHTLTHLLSYSFTFCLLSCYFFSWCLCSVAVCHHSIRGSWNDFGNQNTSIKDNTIKLISTSCFYSCNIVTRIHQIYQFSLCHVTLDRIPTPSDKLKSNYDSNSRKFPFWARY